MELAVYTDLIKQMPYRNQSFETKRKTWQPYANEPEFSKFYQEALADKETITYSREELFSIAQADIYKAIFATILWGYPKGYTRGFNMATLFPKFLRQVDFLYNTLSIQTITSDNLKYIDGNCDGIGLSTLSKLLYFFNIKLGSNRCLIMDARVIDVLNKGTFTELGTPWGISEYSRVRHYPKYLEVCTQLSKKHGYEPDQLELFLFMFGNNLKWANLSTLGH
jgi:hypothetical protein